jgi:stage II sporulation protein R
MCEEIVTAHLDEIVTIAEKVVAEEGYDYEVTAALKEVDFPVKTYGAYTFPAGKYEALKVTIGSGSGHNWWCVMYPNMCFSGSVYEVVEEDAGEALKEVLTKEEYEEVFSGGKVKVEFKYLTFLNELFD